MVLPHKDQTYERIKADLLAEAQSVGVHAKGAPLDPVLELLINGFARELESIFDRVDDALEHNRKTLLRNYFNEPFLERPAQTVISVQVDKRVTVGPDLRIIWQRAAGGLTPEYSLLGEREMIPLELAAVFYWAGDSIYRLRWDDKLRMSSTQYATTRTTSEPCLLLGLSTTASYVDSGHLSILVQPNDTGILAAFPGTDSQLSFANYLDAAGWSLADPGGSFTPNGILSRSAPADGLPGCDATSRFPTEDSFFARLRQEHLYSPMVYRFDAGKTLPGSVLPAPLQGLAELDQEPDLADLEDLSGQGRWLQVKFPFTATDDPRDLFSLIAVNARLAVGYKRNPSDRFNFKHDDYNLATGLFEFGLADRPGQYCSSFGRWVVYRLDDQEGQEFPYIYDALARDVDHWFTLEAGADDVTLMIHLPLRKVADVGYFDLATGHVIGQAANSTRLDVLSQQPANALDYPEVSGLHLLVPARGGGDGYEAGTGAPDSLLGGNAEGLARQYAQTAVWLRTRSRLTTLPDIDSFLRAMDARIAGVRAEYVTLERAGKLVPGVRMHVSFSPSARLPREEQAAICRLADKQIAGMVPMGMWVDIRPDDKRDRK